MTSGPCMEAIYQCLRLYNYIYSGYNSMTRNIGHSRNSSLVVHWFYRSGQLTFLQGFSGFFAGCEFTRAKSKHFEAEIENPKLGW